MIRKHVVDNGITKLSRTGRKLFGRLNLPIWLCPFPNMGKKQTFDRKVVRTKFFTKIIAMAFFDNNRFYYRRVRLSAAPYLNNNRIVSVPDRTACRGV